MSAPIKINIDLKKLKKSWMKEHSNGALYCDLIIYENDEPDKYGNTHSVKQGMPKAARDAGEKAGYLGNGGFLERKGNSAPAAQPAREQKRQTIARQAEELDDESIPF